MSTSVQPSVQPRFCDQPDIQLPVFFRSIAHFQRTDHDTDLYDLLCTHFQDYGRTILIRAVHEDIRGGLFDAPWGGFELPTHAQFPRPGVFLTKNKLPVADALITLARRRGVSLDFVLSLSVPDEVVAYYVIDHNLPVPAMLSRRKFWSVVSGVITELRLTKSIYLGLQAPSWSLPADTGTLPPDCVREVFADPLGILQVLYTSLRPRTFQPAPRATDVFKGFTVAIGVSDKGFAASCYIGGTEFVVTQRLRTGDEGRFPEREAHAILDVAVCLAHLWAGHAVRFLVCSRKTCNAVNGFASTAATDLLHALGRRFAFEPIAVLMPNDYSEVQSMVQLSELECTSFRQCSMCVETMDAILMDATAAVDTGSEDFAVGLGITNLMHAYQRTVVECFKSQAELEAYEPGSLYRTMREQQLGARGSALQSRFAPNDALNERAIQMFWRWKDDVDAGVPCRRAAMNDKTSGDTVGARLRFEPPLRPEDEVLHTDNARLVAISLGEAK